MPGKLSKAILVLLLALYSIAFANPEQGYHINILQSDDSAILCEVTFDSAKVLQKKVDGRWYSEISIAGLAFSEQPGKPRLPVASIMLGIPSQATPRVTLLDQQSTTRSIGPIVPYKKSPSPQPEEKLLHQTTEPETGTQWFPADFINRGMTGFIRDQRILQVEIYPVRYLASQRLTQVVRSLRFRVDFEAGSAAEQTLYQSAGGKKENGFENVFKLNLANYTQAKKWRARPGRKSGPLKTVESAMAPYRYKLLVENDGVYVVTGRELEKAGADLSTIDPATLSLTNRGNQVPIMVEGDGDGRLDPDDRILFIGEHNSGDDTYYSWFSETNVYWLTWGSGVGSRFVEISGLADGTEADTLRSAQVHVHLEQDRIYERILGMPREDLDHWFWQYMNLGEKLDLKLPISHAVQDGTFEVKVGLQGLTHLSVSPDHHVLFKMNGEKIGDAVWDNQKQFNFSSQQLSSELLGEENVLTISLPGDLPLVNVDKVMLNWVEIDYERSLVASNDSLRFTADNTSGKILALRSFSTPDVYILTTNGQRIKDFTVVPTADGYSFYFASRFTLPENFIIVGKNRLKKVVDIVSDQPSDLMSGGNGADYIIITHKDFEEQAQKLADYRAGQGLRTMVVDVQDVYDEFSYGIYDPRAIKRFLKYAYENWQRPAPLYILLLGDTTHNMDKKVARESNYRTFVPTMMEYTVSWGMTSSDNYFVAISGDDPLPDMFISRMPANTPEEASIMVQKTIDYETAAPITEWRRHVYLLTGNDEFFETSARYLYDNYIPQRFVTDWLSTDYRSRHFGSTEEMVRYINNGQILLNFIGHGGGGVYFDSELFLTEDVARLANKNKYPIAFSLTCFIGHFDNPNMPSLSEDLLKARDKGIVAHFGSSGRAYLWGDYFLNNALFDAIFNKNMHRLGEVVSYGKYEMIRRTNSYWDHVKNYILMGDPALLINLPSDAIKLQLSKVALSDGDQLVVSGTVTGAKSGRIILSAFNDLDSLLVQKEFSLQDGKFQVDLLTIDADMRKAWSASGGKGIVRAYFSNDEMDAASAVTFMVNQPLITNMEIEPKEPTNLTPVYILVRLDHESIASFGGVSSVDVVWSANQTKWDTLATTRIDSVTWKTLTAIEKTEGTTVFYRAIINGSNGRKSEGELSSYLVKRRPDLIVDAKSIGVGGTTQVVLRATVKNIGEIASGPFALSLYNGLEVVPDQKIGSNMIFPGLGAGSDTTVSIIWPNAHPGAGGITFQVDPDKQVTESDEKNNVTKQPLWLAEVTSGTGGWVETETGNYAMQIPARGVSQNVAIRYEETWDSRFASAASQSGLLPVRVANGKIRVFTFGLNGDNPDLQKPVQVTAFYNPADTSTQRFLQKGALRLYAWNPTSETWLGLESTVDESKHSVVATLPTEYNTCSLMASSDNAPPVIALSVEGQNFVDGDVVSKNPTFTVSVQDENGFDASLDPVRILLDGEEVDKSAVSLFQEPETKKTMTVTYAPKLQSGEHSLRVQAVDINGNASSLDVSFAVAGEFALAAIANHPNPFQEETTIAFTLTDMASEVTLGIYTVSGRLIRTFTFTDITGYVELDWDGSDEQGNQVANGVYYLKFTAKNKDRKIVRIEKMARLQ